MVHVPSQEYQSNRNESRNLEIIPIKYRHYQEYDNNTECSTLTPLLNTTSFKPKQLSVRLIKKTIKDYANSAFYAQQAGYDGVEIMGSEGYLINQFLSGFSNIREDEYGGDVYNRARFAEEIVEEIRGRLGNDYPISFKISAQEFVSNGLTVDESIQILKKLKKP